jgi:aspartate racemase
MPMRRPGPLIGVLGGMGPLATADFMRQMAELTSASCDQDHYRSLVYSNPRIPDRSQAILGEGPSPLPELLEGVMTLARNGADIIAIPCNSAHHWLDELVAATRVPIISICDAVLRDLILRGIRTGAIGILGTRGTIRSGIYQERLRLSGFASVEPTDAELSKWVEPTIRAVKAGEIDVARSHLRRAIEALETRGAEAIVLGCTELPIAVDRSLSETSTPLIDSTRSLAAACIAWAMDAARPETRNAVELLAS